MLQLETPALHTLPSSRLDQAAGWTRRGSLAEAAALTACSTVSRPQIGAKGCRLWPGFGGMLGVASSYHLVALAIAQMLSSCSLAETAPQMS